MDQVPGGAPAPATDRDGDSGSDNHVVAVVTMTSAEGTTS
jgi:hypothetical protein